MCLSVLKTQRLIKNLAEFIWHYEYFSNFALVGRICIKYDNKTFISDYSGCSHDYRGYGRGHGAAARCLQGFAGRAD